ncbi:hypothetical protein [Nostoc sp.]
MTQGRVRADHPKQFSFTPWKAISPLCQPGAWVVATGGLAGLV